MVWGCFAVPSVGDLLRIDGVQTKEATEKFWRPSYSVWNAALYFNRIPILSSPPSYAMDIWKKYNEKIKLLL